MYYRHQAVSNMHAHRSRMHIMNRNRTTFSVVQLSDYITLTGRMSDHIESLVSSLGRRDPKSLYPTELSRFARSCRA